MARPHQAIVDAAIRQYLTATIERVYDRTAFNIRTQVASIARSGTVGYMQGVKALAIGFENNLADSNDMAEMYRRIAEKMHEAVKEDFDAKVKSLPGRYRVGTGPATSGGFLMRYSGGSLRRAIFNPALIQASSDDIRYIDEGRLFKEAAHWARMNFGTQPYQRSPRMYPLIYAGVQVGRVGSMSKTRPGFDMPKGRWMTKGGQRVSWDAGRTGLDQFHLVGSGKGGKGGRPGGQRRRNTKRRYGVADGRSGVRGSGLYTRTTGIEPRDFLNAGYRVYAEEMPRELSTLVNRWYSNAASRQLLPPRIAVTPGGVRGVPR